MEDEELIDQPERFDLELELVRWVKVSLEIRVLDGPGPTGIRNRPKRCTEYDTQAFVGARIRIAKVLCAIMS